MVITAALAVGNNVTAAVYRFLSMAIIKSTSTKLK